MNPTNELNINESLETIWAARPTLRNAENLPHQDYMRVVDKAYLDYKARIQDFFKAFDALEFDPQNMAHCVVKNWQHVWKCCEEEEQNPAIETFCLTPRDAKRHIEQECWFICWEAGPYDWGIHHVLGEGDEWIHAPDEAYAETYWGFDMMMYED